MLKKLYATYDEIFTFENLYRAHKRCRKSKRDKNSTVKFEMAMLQNLQNLYCALKDRSYKVGEYMNFKVDVPRQREIQTLRYCDRVVQHAICDEYLTPLFSKCVVFDNAACQSGKGTQFATDRFCRMLRKFVSKYGTNGWVLKCDIKKYFASIPHEKLKEKIFVRIEDADLKNLIGQIIDGYHTNFDFLERHGIGSLTGDNIKSGRGVPIGNLLSQLFAMFYLDEVDRLIKEKLRIKIYSRYMDDFVLVCHEKEEVESAFVAIKQKVEELGLSFNEKTQIFPLKNGIPYLGIFFRVVDGKKIIKTILGKTKKRLRWRVRYLRHMYLKGQIGDERLKLTLAAFQEHLSKTKSWKFERELFRKINAITEDKKCMKSKK